MKKQIAYNYLSLVARGTLKFKLAGIEVSKLLVYVCLMVQGGLVLH